MSLLLVGSAESSGYNINNSLRFRSSASASLSRTPASAGNRTTWTWSGWVKRGLISGAATYGIFEGFSTSTALTSLHFNNDKIRVQDYLSPTYNLTWETSSVFRDPSAWYHILLAYDTTQASSANAVKIYVNGVQQTLTFTAFGGSYLQNRNSFVNATNVQYIGRYTATNYFDGYMAEVNFIDGQALTPSSFGSTNATTGVWQPAKYTGTYGTNGFYQQYSNIALTSGSNTGLGQDFSSNGNFYNTTNISVTSGATYDAMTDSPTLTSPTVGNYCVLNNIALIGTATTNGSTSNANLTATTATSSGSGVGATMAVNMPSGNKWYWEVILVSGVTTAASACQLGVCENSAPDGIAGTFYGYNSSDSPTYTNGDTISFAYDGAASILYCYKNNVLAKTVTSVSSNAPLIPAIRDNLGGGAIVAHFNFGQRPFTYTPPAGYVRLNTFNIPDSTIVKGNLYMDATIYAGNGAANSGTTQTLTTSFTPDLLWIKNRTSGSANHVLFDSLRGNNSLSTNNTNADIANGNQAFVTNGYIVAENGGTGNIAYNPNLTGNNYVGWVWDAGSSTVTNTSGTISSQVRANTTAGFSIVTYTSQASGTGTVGHGLGVAPKLIITKIRNLANNWNTYHASLGAGNVIYLNLTNASTASTSMWNNTAPTSNVFSLGTDWAASYSSIAYCWAEIAGFSRFGSYTGNGNADGTFVYIGFRPKFFFIKNSSGTAGWRIYDTSRSSINVSDQILFPNTAGAEGSGAAIDIVSNGFKLRNTSNNVSANTYIYAAFAENPFKNALAR